MKKFITRRTAVKRLFQISNAMAFSPLTDWPLRCTEKIWAQKQGTGFIVEGLGQTEGNITDVLSKHCKNINYQLKIWDHPFSAHRE